MNAVIALCHFCEVHGPQVVMCTQSYSKKYENSNAQLHVIDKCTGDEVKNYLNNNKKFHLYDIHNQSNNQKQTCPSCTSIGKYGLPNISNDHTNKITYMSSETPEDNSQFSLLRHACLRSLTCEVTPGEEGAIYFGEESNTHVLSYRFKLQNAFSRGQKSKYSIVVVSKDKLALLNVWPFLVSNLKIIIGRLQSYANTVCHEELANENARNNSRFSNSNLVASGGPSDLHPAVNHRTRAENESRSLVQITRREDVYIQLHVWFTWLLRVGESTYQSLQVNSPDHAALQKSSALFSNEFSQKGTGLSDADLEKQMVCLIQLYQLLGVQHFSLLLFHAVVGNQVIVRCTSEKLAKTVINSMARLLPCKCARVGYDNTSYRPLFQYNLLALDTSVPLSDEVTDVDGDPCVVLLINILESNMKFGLPTLTNDQVNVRMDSSKPPIVGSSLTTAAMTPPQPQIVKQYMEILAKASVGLINLTNNSSEHSPINTSSNNSDLTDSTVGNSYTFNNPNFVPQLQPHYNMTPKIAAVTLEIVTTDWIDKTELYYAYKRRQTKNRLTDAVYESRLDNFLKSIGVQGVSDHGVLRFWVSGLSDETKKQITVTASANNSNLNNTNNGINGSINTSEFTKTTSGGIDTSMVAM